MLSQISKMEVSFAPEIFTKQLLKLSETVSGKTYPPSSGVFCVMICHVTPLSRESAI